MIRRSEGFAGKPRPLNAFCEKIEAREAAFISSEILIFEVQRIISPPKRAKVSIYLGLHQDYYATTSETLAVANEIIWNYKLAPRDALHAASVALGECSIFSVLRRWHHEKVQEKTAFC